MDQSAIGEPSPRLLNQARSEEKTLLEWELPPMEVNPQQQLKSNSGAMPIHIETKPTEEPQSLGDSK